MNPSKTRISAWDEIGIDEFKFPNRKNIRVSCPKCKERKKERNENFWVYGDNHTFGQCKSASCEYSNGFYVYEGNFVLPEESKYNPERDEDKQWEDERWAKRLGLSARGFNRQDMNKMGVFPTTFNWKETDTDKTDFAIAFPFYDENGKCVNVAYRPPKDRKHLRQRFHKSSEIVFYNLVCLKEYANNDKKIPYIVITEGFEDCISCIKAGLEYTLSVPNGVSFSKDNPTPPTMKYLVRNMDLIQRAEVVYIFTDNDGAGEFLATELSRRIGIQKCRRVKMPLLEMSNGKHAKDANDILQWSVQQRNERPDWAKLGLSIIANILNKDKSKKEDLCYSVNFAAEGIADAETDNDRVRAMLHEDEDRGLRVSIGNESYPTDDILRFNHARMGAIYGRPNTAKTDIWINYAVRLAFLHGWKFAIYSPETGKTAKLKAHVCQIILGKMISKNPYLGERATELELDMALTFFDEHFMIIDESCVEGESISLKKFVELGKQYVELYGINCLICDPFNGIEGAYGAEQGVASNVVLQRDLRILQRLKTQYNVSIWFVIHPSKGGLQANKGALTSFDSAYFSTVWEAKLDWILVVNRLTDSNMGTRPQIYGDDISLLVAKNKEPLEGRALGLAVVTYSHVTGQTGVAYDISMAQGGINYRKGSFKAIISLEPEEESKSYDLYNHFADRETKLDTELGIYIPIQNAIISPTQIDEECPF